ncbi:MAG TPA: tryptophan--tRNA ligase [Gemmatimonadaceae bacterium]|jgi:tryptophanyl-tRNA synthetase
MSRIFSGIQPTGELHIGNYLGAVKNWVRLQHEYEAIFCIVDYHAITLAYDPDVLRARRHDMAVGLLAAGIDPAVCSLYAQSQVPEHTELAWFFNTITPLGELERQTQFKEKSTKQESVLAGILNYPVLQAADILLYRADLVPVGEDQVQHLELSRVIARRWNAAFGKLTGATSEDGTPEREDFFPEPKALLTPTRRILGLDGQSKMSKSMGNTIGMLEAPESIWSKLRPAVTDPKRIRKTDPGTPEVCNIYHLHQAFSTPDTVEHVGTQCRSAGWGCIDCKKVLAESMETELVPIRRRAAELAEQPSIVEDALATGAERCRRLARETIDVVRDRMGF